MASKSVLKVAGGKLVKVELESWSGEISRVKITGDFFVHPEEALVELEECLQGCGLEEAMIAARLEEKVYENGCQLVGFSPADIAKAILMAAAAGEQENSSQ